MDQLLDTFLLPIDHKIVRPKEGFRMKIDISADVGESFGRWKLGYDEELMEYISSANVACGFHGGDPMVMRQTARMARKHGVKIGTHVGFPDLMGFGRRFR